MFIHRYENDLGLTVTVMQPENEYEADNKYREVSTRYIPRPNNVPADVKEKWITALTDGSFKQEQNVLCRLDNKGKVLGHCCLGVLCEIQELGYNVDDLTKQFVFPFTGKSYHDLNGGSLGGDWFRVMGMHDGKGTFDIEFDLFGKTYYQTFSLAHLNDNGMTFSQIADIIRHFF